MDYIDNIYAAWIGILLGIVTGALQGLRFHDEKWLGGYGSWPRRLTRLGHISFFGLAFLNLFYATSAHILEIEGGTRLASALLIIGAITMPLICYLSAWKKPIRHLFFIPVSTTLLGVLLFLLRMLQ